MAILPMYIPGYSASIIKPISKKSIHLSQDKLKSITDNTSYQKVFNEAFSGYTVNFLTTPTFISGYDGLCCYNGSNAVSIQINNFEVPKRISMTYYTPSLGSHRIINFTMFSMNLIQYHLNSTSSNGSAPDGCWINGSYSGAGISQCYQKVHNVSAGFRGTVEWTIDCPAEYNESFRNNTHETFKFTNAYGAGSPTTFVIEDLEFEF